MPAIHPKEIQNVLRLDPAQRYQHFLKIVVGVRAVWSLGNQEGFVLAGDPDGVELVPLWPAPEYAQLCARDEWADCVPREIPLEKFMELWATGMHRDGRKCNVFPTPGDSGANVDPLKLREHLLDSLSRIEYMD